MNVVIISLKKFKIFKRDIYCKTEGVKHNLANLYGFQNFGNLVQIPKHRASHQSSHHISLSQPYFSFKFELSFILNTS
jgi:hypothetical protein